MSPTISELSYHQLPERLQRLASPPKLLYHRGASLEELLQRPIVSVVGSRKVSHYGRQVTVSIVRELAEQGIVIVSGLAFGVDAIAHQAALDAGGLTVAVLPSPLEDIYPATNRQLAEDILSRGGALISEYAERTESFKSNFVARNRIVAGLADALLITEAAEKSGSLHTARFALEQEKDVLAVPGNITSPTSVGTNNLLKAGAHPATSAKDVLSVLQLKYHSIVPLKIPVASNDDERAIINALKAGETDADLLQQQSGLNITLFNQTLTMLELTGKIRPLGAGHWALA